MPWPAAVGQTTPDPPTKVSGSSAWGLMPTVLPLTGDTRSTPSKTQNPRGPTAGTG